MWEWIDKGFKLLHSLLTQYITSAGLNSLTLISLHARSGDNGSHKPISRKSKKKKIIDILHT